LRSPQKIQKNIVVSVLLIVKILSTILKKLTLVYAESETRPIMNAHEYINNELEFNLKHSYVFIEGEVIDTLDERNDAADNEPIKEINNV
jgi:hypothetical protein